MPGKRKFEEQLAAMDALRQLPRNDCIEPLRKALGQRNNYLVAKGADLVRELALTELIPELLAAFDRFFDDPAKSDPQCWAKNALSRALAALEHQDAATFLRGMRHIQLEPVWGGQSDTAPTLRATCALALVQCRNLPNDEVLAHLVDLVGDKEKVVRLEVNRAIEQVGTTSAALLLRLKAMLEDEAPEVLGAAYSGILHLEGTSSIAWISRFLDREDDNAAEAAFAIAGTHWLPGFEVLRNRFSKTSNPWFRSVLLSAIALTRQDAAVDFLLDLIRADSTDAEAAIEALLRASPTADLTHRLEELVAGKSHLARAFATHKKNSSPR